MATRVGDCALQDSSLNTDILMLTQPGGFDIKPVAKEQSQSWQGCSGAQSGVCRMSLGWFWQGRFPQLVEVLACILALLRETRKDNLWPLIGSAVVILNIRDRECPCLYTHGHCLRPALCALIFSELDVLLGDCAAFLSFEDCPTFRKGFLRCFWSCESDY